MPLVPVPATEKATVTSAEAVVERVAVSVIDVPLFSAMELALADRDTVGVLSSSVIVSVTCWVPLSVAFVTELMSMMAVSSPSEVLSFVGVKVVVPVVEPAETVILESAV